MRGSVRPSPCGWNPDSDAPISWGVSRPLTKAVPWHVFSVGEACSAEAFVEFVSELIELRASAFAGVFLCVEQPHLPFSR